MIDDDRILLLSQDTDTGRTWSLPGGKVEEGESLVAALARETREKTGLEVEPGRLLYVCDHLPGSGTHVVHLTFQARVVGGTAGEVAAGLDTRPIRAVEFVKLADLPSLGASRVGVPRCQRLHGRQGQHRPVTGPGANQLLVDLAQRPGTLHSCHIRGRSTPGRLPACRFITRA